MNLKMKLDEGAYVPTRAHEDDAGLDLYTPIDVTIPAGRCVKSFCHDDARMQELCEVGSNVIDTGVHVAIPRGYVGYIKSKSGLNVRHGLTGEGVIDCGYTGSIRVKLYNHTAEDYHFKAGEKIAQLVIHPILLLTPEMVFSLDETERGDGGFGSTGK